MFGEQKRFTLKTPKPKEVAAPVEAAVPPMAPPPVPAPELPASPVGGEEMDFSMDSEEMGPEGDMEMDTDMDMEMDGGDDEQVTFKTIQKLTGKLTQKIRTLDTEEGMTSEDIKYVINMVISSLDLNSLSEEDRDILYGEDPIKKFKSAFPVEFYLSNALEYMGDKEFFTKFGLEIRNNANVIISPITLLLSIPNWRANLRA